MTGFLPKERIVVIDALRGFALMGILLLHCMEHFECYLYPETTSEVVGWFDDLLSTSVWGLFSGKAYAIFSLLFGLSFFIQMKNQEERGIDFRGRFVWRLVLLYLLGYINGLSYLGEIFAVYAVMGMILVPLYKVSGKWLKPLAILSLLHLPYLLWLIAMLVDPSITHTPFEGLNDKVMAAYGASNIVYSEGSYADVLSYNLWTAHLQKWMWFVWSPRILQIVGLFVLGMLIGRAGIHRDRDKMIYYSKRALGYGLLITVVFYCLMEIMPLLGLENAKSVEFGQFMFKYYMDSGIMFVLIGLFVLSYFCLGARKALDNLAPVGRMSVTNYMLQSLIGAFLFYGYGVGLALKLGYTYSFLVGIVFITVQILWSKWWMKRYYYGPMEWLWRSLTWLSFKNVPFKRK
jgi:uncharacterized protein